MMFACLWVEKMVIFVVDKRASGGYLEDVNEKMELLL